MISKINQETIEITTDCEKSFRCITSSTRGVCKVVETISDSVIFVDFDKSSCAYAEKTSTRTACFCPV